MANTIHPVLKPEAKRITQGHQALGPYHDEKHECYKKHSEIAADVFERARQARAAMTSEYEARNKMVHDRLQALRAQNDLRIKQSLDNLKDFSNGFDEGMAQRKKAWKSELKASKEALQKRGQANDAELERFDQMIKDEHEETKVYTQAQVGPTLQKLQAHRDALALTVSDRNRSNEEFNETVAERFKRLRESLAEESVSRKKECIETSSKAKEQYEELSKEMDSQYEGVEKRIVELNVKLVAERADTKNSNTWITHEMMTFMAHFEKSVAECLSKQEASKAHLDALRTSFNP